MMPMLSVTIVYLDRMQQPVTMQHEVADLNRPTIAAMVDLIEGQIGTVLTVHHERRNLYRNSS